MVLEEEWVEAEGKEEEEEGGKKQWCCGMLLKFEVFSVCLTAEGIKWKN